LNGFKTYANAFGTSIILTTNYDKGGNAATKTAVHRTVISCEDFQVYHESNR